MTPARDLKGSRRDLAIVFSEGQRTAHEAAKQLGRPTGSIFGVLQRMHAEGILAADSDPGPPTRGTQYALSAMGQDLLRAALPDESDAIGRIEPGQRMLVVRRLGRLTEASEVLAGAKGNGLVDWGSELPDGWLLTLVENADRHRLDVFVTALERARCECRELTVDTLYTGTRLRDRARSLIEQVT
jgi:DNA-binding PadR family transcriptional regulator